jgi:transposase-like protein
MARRVFTTEFKESAVRLASAPGAIVDDVAHELGIAA